MERPFALAPRLFVEGKLEAGRLLEPEEKGHYLAHVLRAQPGMVLRLFNGHDGEWRAEVRAVRKATVQIEVMERLREQHPAPDLRLFCAPLKKAHFDDLIMRATELGVAHIQPILTGRTQVREANTARLHAIAVEAAEQSERLEVPSVQPLLTLEKILAAWSDNCLPVVCAEAGEAEPIGLVLSEERAFAHAAVGFFVGPEGGFLPEELVRLGALPGARLMRLGPRILRADTAGMAALAAWQSVCGDWAGAV